MSLATRGRGFVLALLAVAITACDAGPRPDSVGPTGNAKSSRRAVQFHEVAAKAGVDFVSVCGSVTKDWVLEVNGGGVAFIDYDGDGDQDLFFVNGSRLPAPFGAGAGSPPPSDALYRNLGGMKFENVTRAAGLVESDWGCGVAVADYDNDGDDDIFVTNYGSDRLWRNEGDGRFTDATRSAGLGDDDWGSSAAFLDYDRDGFVDLLVVNYLVFDPRNIKRRGEDPTCQYKGQKILCGPVGLPPAPCSLYRNLGDGRFEDRSEASGIRSVKPSYGLGVALIDFDADDWIDVYVANDTRPNLLFRNRGDGTFEEVGMRTGVGLNDQAIAQAGMGVDAVFLREGAAEDLFVTNYEDDSNTFYRNDGGYFLELTSAVGLAGPCFPYLGWGTFFFDPDLDADLDVFIAQGHVVPQADEIPTSPGYTQPNKLFVNDGSGKFEDVSSQAGPAFAVSRSSRGAAFGDLDGDGDPDIAINDMDGPVSLFENKSREGRHWLAVKLRGTRSNRNGIGAVVSVETEERTQRLRVRSGSSYASQSELLARFGLGSAPSIDALRVRWPDGTVESFPSPELDRIVELTEGTGEPARR